MRPIISTTIGNTTYEPCIEPLKCVITRSDLYSDSTGRSAETGTLMQYPIRTGLYSIELEYLGNDLEIEQIETMIGATKFSVSFIYNGVVKTAIMYPSDRVNDTEIILNGEGRHRLSFTLIEV
ncbi:MAG: hypothetical protein J6Y71_07550 [Ruminococcus sp.]|nr:hypothetical protein [Ruminococcus sp.]